MGWVRGNVVDDNLLILLDNADNTKSAQFELSGISTGTNRTYSLPNANGVVAVSSAALTAGRIPYIGTGGVLSDSTTLQYDALNGRLSVGAGSSPSARIHSLSTTEQLRVGYDTSNYYSTTIGSTGAVVFDAVGSGAQFTFNDKILVTLTDTTINNSLTVASYSLTKNISSNNSAATYANTNTLTLQGAGGHLNAIGTQNYIVNSGTSTSNVFRATYSRVNMSGSGAASSITLNSTHFEGQGTGVIANFYGFAVGSVGGNFVGARFSNPSNTITNTYGFYIGDLTDGTQTNTPWGLYQDDTGIRNYFAAPLGLGTNSSLTEALCFGDAKNIKLGTVTGSKIGTATTQKLGFWNATPVVQPASAAQAAVTGTAGALYTATEQTLINDLKTLVNQLRSDLVTVGLIKGAA